MLPQHLDRAQWNRQHLVRERHCWHEQTHQTKAILILDMITYYTTGFKTILTPNPSLGATCWDASFSSDLLLSSFSITPRRQGSTSQNQLFGIRLEWQNQGKVFKKTTTRQDKGWNAQLQAKAGFFFLLHGGCSLSCTLHNLPHGESQPSALLHICSHYWRSVVLRCGGQHTAILLAGW